MTTLGAPSADIAHNAFYTEHKFSWWNLNSYFRLVAQIDQLSLEYIKDVLRKKGLVRDGKGFELRTKLRVLDVGCGGGLLCEPLARAGCDILGIDINRDCVDVAKEHATLDPCLKNIEYRWESIEDHSLTNVEKYDIVISNFVLLHARNHELLIKSCLKTLKPGGIIFLSSCSKTFVSWLRLVAVAQNIMQCYPPNTFDWYKFINCWDVEKILEQCKCKVEGTKGIYYDLFSSNYKWKGQTNELYILNAIKG